MKLTDFLTPARIADGARAGSKKRALEMLSELLTHGTDLTPGEAYESLLARERLGGTGLGHGVAIPHGRLKHAGPMLGAFVHLLKAVDYDAPDKQPVDLLFALLVPEQSSEEHLQALALLAEMLRDKMLREELRQAKSGAELFDLLTRWRSRAAPS
ncbi:MAG: PTS sugar transporter subunit IIA [Gammaproteobacteria bacterium]|nr:MAG: PTS sugar transporter subunit IIA [Gammaproteobacteria bacterium]